MENREFAKNSLERYQRTEDNYKDIMSEQILMTADAMLRQVLNEWIDVYQEEPNSKVYKELCRLSDRTNLFDL